MNLGFDLSLRTEQKLSFQMIQSLKLLQVNTLQLEQLIREELELNPVLEIAEEERDEAESEGADDTPEREKESEDPLDDTTPSESDEVDWDEYLEESYESDGTRGSDEYDPNHETYERTPVYQKSLEEYLEDQIQEKRVDEEKRLLVRYVIGCLDEDGYLRQPLDQVAEGAHVETYAVEEALSVIQSMDPPGVGAQTLQECLIIQLRRVGLVDSIAMKIVAIEWELFEKLKIPELARRLGVEPRDVQSGIDIIKRLNPRPGYAINPDRSSTVMPDLIVEKVDGEWIVVVNDRSVPSLHISRAYAEMMRRGSKATKEAKQYIREKFNGASWLIRAIEQRRSTMLKVMYAIIERQKTFFDKGPPNLAPLKLQDVADMIEMHISTISRVTSNKYAQTPHGVFELKYFFTEALGTDEDGADISTARIKSRLGELIAAEDKSDPLSDQRLAEILEEEGLKCARRTVAKYREQLKLLPARLRQIYE